MARAAIPMASIRQTQPQQHLPQANQLEHTKECHYRSESTANLSIKWDTVENADYYKVTVTGKTAITAANNSTSIAVSELKTARNTPSVLSHVRISSTDYPDPAAATIKYTYKTLSKKLDAPATSA